MSLKTLESIKKDVDDFEIKKDKALKYRWITLVVVFIITMVLITDVIIPIVGYLFISSKPA
jgi:hypothetical protein